MTISNKAEKILNAALREPTAGNFTVVHKHKFPTGTCAKSLAFHCYHNDILFYWSIENYYFKRAALGDARSDQKEDTCNLRK